MSTPHPLSPFAIHVRDLTVRYRGGLGRSDIVAVSEVGFEVLPGEVIGFVGPNGAGKSTTIKALMGFIVPESGEARIFGHPTGSAAAKERIGYLPEVALYYPFLKAGELLYNFGRLAGMSRAELAAEIPQLLQLVGLNGKADVPLSNFSKGMLQRVGIAQALLGRPDLLILDEVASGLDPTGRRELRQILRDLQSQGTTIFFSSHQLSEVELLCSRVLVVHHGRIIKEGPISELTRSVKRTRIAYRYRVATSREGIGVHGEVEEVTTAAESLGSTIHDLTRRGAEIIDVNPENIGLEDYFVELLAGAEVQ